jgi:predicted transport protein
MRGDRILDSMDAHRLFPGDLASVYEAMRRLVRPLGDDIVEEFAKTQVSFGSLRKFAWLTPVTKTKALLVLDLWEERTAPQLRNVIRYRDDKFTHQVEVRTAKDVEAVDALGWFNEAASWGRKRRS